MTDAPGDFEHVNLVITEVSARMEGGAEADTDSVDFADSEGGWVTLASTPATYDLIALRNGVFTTIGTGLVPAGHYTQVRLKLGAGSTVTVDGVDHPLIVPSGMQSGLKLIGSFDVPANGTVDVALDFDAARSVFQTGAGDYHLKPTVKIMPVSAAGAIAGTVSPDSTLTTVYALQGADTLGSTITATNGHFLLGTLAPGTYSVAFDPPIGYRDTTLFGVGVTVGATTEVGTVQLTAE
jgi:hypothetical protein